MCVYIHTFGTISIHCSIAIYEIGQYEIYTYLNLILCLSKKFIEEIRKCRVLWTLCTFLFKEYIHGGKFLLLCCIALLLINRLAFYITNAFDYVRFLLSIFILEGISASVISRKKYFSHCTFSYRWLAQYFNCKHVVVVSSSYYHKGWTNRWTDTFHCLSFLNENTIVTHEERIILVCIKQRIYFIIKLFAFWSIT